MKPKKRVLIVAEIEVPVFEEGDQKTPLEKRIFTILQSIGEPVMVQMWTKLGPFTSLVSKILGLMP
jgi:hypothetical protein